jgi:hypothetical protein
MTEILETDWAYAAAFVDGEGCIAITRSFVPRSGRYSYGVCVVVANRDWAVLDWMHHNWGGWVVAFQPGQGRARQCWNWRSPTGLSAKAFLSGIRPWLRIKGRQCDNALVMIDLLQRGRRTLGRAPLPQEWLDEQEEHYWLQRELNHRGTDVFERKEMHSPRRIHRERRLQQPTSEHRRTDSRPLIASLSSC